MAESESILVSVVESAYIKLRNFGVPLPVCSCMQDKGLQLESAQWTALLRMSLSLTSSEPGD